MRDEVTVTVRPPDTGDPDDFGDRTPAAPAAPVEIPNCLFAPGTFTERTDPRQPAVISGGTLYVKAGQLAIAKEAITPACLIDVPGYGNFTIEGDLGIWGSACAEVALKRWTGRTP